MTNPILIDTIYINAGGAMTVINRLLDGLAASCVDYILIKDSRCKGFRTENKAREIIVMEPQIRDRQRYYNTHKYDFSTVLCMGNVPPPIKMPCPVHTYFHNLSVLQTPPTYSKKRKLLFFLKKQYIKFMSKNTDSWIVQTWNSKNLLMESLGNTKKDFYIYPIYTIPESFKNITNVNRNDYLFIGDYTFSKGHDVLLEAWEKLHDMGDDLRLHLTVNRRPVTEPFCLKVDKAINKGVNIINHDFLPFEKVVGLYAQCKAVVYPSQLESLGLGLVEGLSAGCDVITSDLPFAHAICKPSEVFDPFDSDSIVKAILRYEEGRSPKSVLTIHDCLDELIDLIRK